MKVRLELGTLGLVDSRQKEGLSKFLPESAFTQRKNFYEYYVTDTTCETDLELSDLMRLCLVVKVIVLSDCILLTQWGRG
jgi:hypothetical protein